MKKLFTLLILAILATATGFAETWVQTAITDLQDGDIVVIFDKSSKRALSNDNGTSAAPKAVSVAVSENATEITEDVAENIQWEFYKSGSNFQFKKPSTNNYLYCTNANNGVRVGTNTNRDFALDGNHMKNIGTSRFVGVYNNQDWRCYTSKTTNITNTQTIFFKKVSATLQSIAIEGTPTKTAYNAGETFSTAGLTVKGTYSDDSQKEITQGITWTITPTPLTVGTTSVAVKAAVENVESPVVNYDVTVSEPITLTGLSVAGTAPALWKGDAFSTTGLTFTASFSDGNTQEIAHSNLTFSGYNMNAAGEQTVTASYTYVDVTETATFPINVQTIANTKESAYSVAQAIALIDAGKDLATQVYVKGIVSTIVTAWSDQYMNITFDVSEDGSTTGQQFQFYRNGLKNGAAYTEDPNIEVGATVIGLGTLKKYNTTYEFDANNDLVEYTAPAQKVLESIAISGTPSKTTYEAGESFSTAGLTVMGTYNDGSSADVTANAEWSIEPATLSVGTTSVDVMANVGEVVSDIATYNVTVTAPRVLTALTISGEPTKTAYYAGETFDPAGLVVTATYSNDDTEVITEGLEWDFDPETLALGTTSVDVAVAIGAVMSDVITYNVTVTAAPQPTSAYIDLTKDETTTATTDKLEWVKDAVTVTSSKETSSTNANNYYPGSGGRTSTRFYKDFKLTFAPANGITISSIVYEATSASYASVMANSTWTNATASVDGLTVTITPVDGAQTVSAKIGAATGGESFTINFTGATKTPTTLSFGENIDGQTITKYIGEEDLDYTATLTPAIEGATITYESSNDAIALIDETTGYVVLGQTEGTAVITAKYAGNDAYKPSEASYTIDLKKLPVPTFNPAAGAVDAGTVVTVSTIEGCTLLYYVNDGEVVETETNTATVAINEATTIVATTKKGALESDEVVASYTIKPANPFTLAISPATGEYDGPQTVTITATNGVGEVAITYTTDGTDPAVSETAQYYEAPFTVSETTTIKAYAYDQVGQSAEAEVTITIKPANPLTLAITPATGEYDSPQTVTITATNYEESVSITYTTDGTDPASSETAIDYEAPFTVSETTTIKAFAYDQVGQSAEAEVTITINTPTPEGEKFVLVTDASQLKDGGDIILVGQKTNDSDETTFYALGTTQNTNNRAAVVVTESNGKVAINDEVQVIKLEATTDRDGDAAWMFNVGEDAYLYAASSSSNHLKTNTASIAGNNGKASIEITSENIAMITFQGDNKRNLLKFNATNNPPIFSCYNTTQSPVYIYKRSLPVVEGVTMTGDYKAKFVDSNIRVANSYKNSVAIQNLDAATFAGKQITVTRRAAEGASTKPVPVATVTFSEDGTTYTVAYQNQTEVARYDSEDAPAAGNTANGVNIADYFIFEISSEGDVAGAYIYELASSDVEFDAAPFKAPVFNGTTVAYRMVNADKEGYTREEIVAEVITEQVIEDNSQLGIVKGAGIEFTFEPNAYAPEVTAPTSVTYKRNHAAKTVVEKSGYVYMEAEARQSATYAVEIEVNGNRYGTNAVTLRNAEVQVSPLANSEGQADNQVKSEYTFTATNGKKARYFFVAVTASMTGTGEGGSEATLTTEGGGFRLWRTSVTEPAEQYTGAGYEDFDARKGVYLVHEDMNLTENVGTFYDLGKTEMKFTDKAGTEHTYYKGTFGSSSETPAVTFLSRFYYKDATPVNQQSARRRAAAKAGENADIFYVAEEWYDFAFSNNIPTAVIDIPGVKEVKSVRYFNLMGVESADPVEGVNIVVTTYTDGTTSSAKVLR